ncbi:MAG TPA: hypothetical protein VK478_07660 [Gemmatimonadaceae bacterium]|jgi:hypothetical protein|nr:hypothetical protein [Gemmatimonadaceae bacterium]
MTHSSTPLQQDSAPPSARWLRAIGYGLFAEIATIITIVLVVVFYQYVFARGLTKDAYTLVGQHIGAIIGPVGGTLYVFVFARRLMPKISSGFVAHGIVVALAAIALSIGGSIAGHNGLPAGYTLASALKIIAGASAGFLHQRFFAPNRTV